MRITLSAVTLTTRPASSARFTTSAHGRSSSTPSMSRMPRTAFTPLTPAKPDCRPDLISSPMRRAWSSRPCCSMVSSVARTAAHTSGPPPKVVPWLPGLKTFAAAPRARQAPTGTPEPRPLARAITSGAMPDHWCANHLPVRPMPLCTSSTMSSHSRRSQRARTLRRYSGSATMMPPSPCSTSMRTATTEGLSARRSSAAMSL